MSAPLRVLVVHDHVGHAHGVIHGPTQYLLNVLPRLDRTRFEVDVCFLRGWHPAAALFDAAGIEPTFLGRSKWDPRSFADLLRVIHRRRIDVLHGAGMKASLLGRPVARLMRRPAVIHFHDELPVLDVIARLHRWMADWTDVALCVSRAVADSVTQKFDVPADRTVVLHNGVALGDFRDVSVDERKRIRTELDIPLDAPVIGIVGRFDPLKQYEPLIGALPDVLSRCPGAVLLAAGDGTTRQDCEKLVARLGLESSVRFAGYRSDIPSIMAAIDVLAMPSASEGLGYSAIEALASGKPVVAFHVGGLPEVVIDGRTGFLVVPGDFAALADRLVQLLADPAHRAKLGRQASADAERFSIETHVKRLEEIYETVARTA